MLTTYRRLISQTWKDQLWYNPCVHVGHVPQGGNSNAGIIGLVSFT